MNLSLIILEIFFDSCYLILVMLVFLMDAVNSVYSGLIVLWSWVSYVKHHVPTPRHRNPGQACYFHHYLRLACT